MSNDFEQFVIRNLDLIIDRIKALEAAAAQPTPPAPIKARVIAAGGQKVCPECKHWTDIGGDCANCVQLEKNLI